MTTGLPWSPSAPIVWLAPTLNVAPAATSTTAKLPSAVVLLELSLPPVMATVVPSTRLVAAVLRVTAPVLTPLMVMVRAVPPSLSAPSARVTPAAGAKIGLPESVVAPRVNVAPPPLRFVTFSVLLPMASVPMDAVPPE